MDNQQIKNFIETSRQSGISDDKIVSYLQSKGVNLQGQPEPQKTFGQKATDVVNAIFPGKKIGEAIGTEIARARVPEEQKQFVTQDVKPSQIAGDLLQIGAFFAPVGTVAKGLAVGGKALGLGTKTAQTLGNIGAGGLTGYTFDVGLGLSEDTEKPFSPGVGTLVGAGIPGVGAVARGGARLAGEIAGKTTGAGFGAIRQGLEATTQGGAKGKAFTSALRGQTAPESLVNEAKQGLQTVKQARTQEYLKQLEEISKNKTSLDISPIVEDVGNQLDKFGIEVTEQGLDFSRSPLRFNKQAQDDITTIVNEMKGFGLKAGDRTPIGVDSLKRAFDDLYTPSSEARAFVASVRDKARKVLSQVEGYDDLAKNYADRTDIINEIQKGLSLGDKASVETSFKKLTSALRTNNEYREQFIKELDEATGGELLSKIAGQQLSEIVPRGLSGVLTGAGGALGLASGVGVVPILSAALTTSPRLVGEIVTALGFTGRKANQLLKLIEKNAGKFNFPGDVILEKAKKTPNKQGGFARLPQLSEALDESTIAKTNTIKNSIPKSSPKSSTKSSLKEIYHGTDKIFKEFDVTKTPDGSIWFTDSKSSITGGTSGASGSKRIINRYIDENNLKLAGWDDYEKYSLDQLQAKGFDGVKLPDGNITDYQIFYPEKLSKVKSTLTSETNLINEAKKYKSVEEFVKSKPEMLLIGEQNGFKKSIQGGIVQKIGDKQTRIYKNSKGDYVASRMFEYDTPLLKAQGVRDSSGTEVIYKSLDEAIAGEKEWIGNSTQNVTKSQLTDIWNKANKTVSKADDSLVSEAKKYKSAEEFVKAQGSKTYYHTTSTDVAPIIEKSGFIAQVGDRSLGTTKGKGIFLYEDIKPTENFGKNFTWKGKTPTVIETKVNGKIFNSKSQSKSINSLAEDTNLITRLKKEGYVGIRGTEGGTPVTFIFEPKFLKTKSQLEEIWKKANNKK